VTTVAAPPPAVLARTRATAFVPGSNRRGAALGAAWTLLLDDLRLGHVVCLGVPGERSLRALVQRARAVTLVCEDGRACRLQRRRLARDGIDGVDVVATAHAGDVAAADLLVVTSRRWARRAAAAPALAALVTHARLVHAPLAGGPAAPRSLTLWLGVVDGEVSLAAGLGDDQAIALLRRPAAGTRRRPPVGALAHRLRRRPQLREQAVALVGLPARPGAPVPAYVRDLAAASGVDLEGYRVALTAPGDYPSRKTVLALLAPGAPAPSYVVKLAQDVALNDRLRNEARALRALAAAGIGDGATLPRAPFFGHHAGHAVLGQTAIAGVPFRQVTTGAPDCPAARAAVTWVSELGARTADRASATPGDVADALDELLERYAGLYRPGAAERAALAGSIAAIGASAAPFPLVFQHGDPGTWNILVTDGGRPAFLDWEAAEEHGLPLWDLFYLARSVAVGVARASGTRSSLDAVARGLLADGPLSRALAQDVARHSERIGLEPALAGPLLLTCWMHRALKEAMTLQPDRLARGRYVRLLRLCLHHRDAPGLRLLGGIDQDGAQRRL
jgi:hypothetical protein